MKTGSNNSHSGEIGHRGKMSLQALPAAREAGLTLIRLPPHLLHRNLRPALERGIVSGSASRLTSALRPQASHVAATARTPFLRSETLAQPDL
jgi:hypothetical protein